MTLEEHIKYWLDIADRDLEVAESLFSNCHYLHCLFFGHLVIEKALKANWVKVFEETPPKIHDLVKLADKTHFNLGSFDVSFLDELNKFNLESQYPDYKLEIYKLCTKEYTLILFIRIKEFFQWIKSQLI